MVQQRARGLAWTFIIPMQQVLVFTAMSCARVSAWTWLEVASSCRSSEAQAQCNVWPQLESLQVTELQLAAQQRKLVLKSQVLQTMITIRWGLRGLPCPIFTCCTCTAALRTVAHRTASHF